MKALPKILLALTAAAALSFAHPASANLITNPGFETGDFTGWTNSGGAVVGTFGGVAPHSGNFQAEFGPGANSLSQFVTTTPGTSYVIDFWLAGTGDANKLVVLSWGGTTIFTHFFAGAFGYTEFTFNVTASAASTELKFPFLTNSTGTNTFLDDISVTPSTVPDGGSTVSLLGCALLGLIALRRKLVC